PFYSFTLLSDLPLPNSTLFPYTTLFRSLRAIGPEVLHPEHRCAIDVRRRRGIRQAVVVAGKVGAAGDDYSLADAAATPYVNRAADRKSTRLNSSHVKSSYAVFCLKKKNK